MSLYDGLGLEKEKGIHDTKSDVLGWSSGIKLLQSQLQLKKAALTQAKQKDKRQGVVLPPVVDLKGRNTNEENDAALYASNRENKTPNTFSSGADLLWNVDDEYDPLWPNDYEKIMKERKEKKDKEREEERRREMEERERRRRERYERHRDDHEFESERRRNYDRAEKRMKRREEEDEEDFERPRRPANAGVAIAPPPSLLQENNELVPEIINVPQRIVNSGTIINPALGGSVAAKIMAKYGFREGQGLGKQEQGMSTALQVEKTSKRGGKIIHEKDMPKSSSKDHPDSITETMKNPSKIVLLRNMVGPGEVDDELEPETKEECSKYGDVTKVIIFEIPDGIEEEAVRIFVEFKRIESAIKAVVDLNGRYFGGRIVKATFYNVDKFRRLELAE